ncbi:MAG: radical SAM protein [bacterium]
MSWKLLEEARQVLGRETRLMSPPSGGGLRWVLAYPNTYFTGMSSLGFQTVFGLLNGLPGVTCERAFLPDRESLREFINSGRALFSLESQRPIQECDVLGFSLAYEPDILNILKILDLTGIPLLAAERDESHPIVAVGGAVATLNPDPLANFVDFCVVGEAEEVLPPLNRVLLQKDSMSRPELLRELARIPGVYVPSLYRFSFQGAHLSEIEPLNGAPACVVRQAPPELSFMTHSLILSPDTEFSGTFIIELMRGCPWHCRFCVIGSCFGPFRLRGGDALLEAARKHLGHTKRVGLLGASVTDHPDLERICRELAEEGAEISFSSMRAGSVSAGLLEALVRGGQRTMTLAPETPDEAERSALGKSLPDEAIFQSLALASKAGIRQVRLYFMLGLPGEKSGSGFRIASFLKKIRGDFPGLAFSASVAPFVPKPKTKFQNAPMASITHLREEMDALRGALRGAGRISLQAESPERASIQAIISRGDRRLSKTFLECYDKGTSASWEKALKHLDFNALSFLEERNPAAASPWDVILSQKKGGTE